jgi:hypothetical protein
MRRDNQYTFWTRASCGALQQENRQQMRALPAPHKSSGRMKNAKG